MSGLTGSGTGYAMNSQGLHQISPITLGDVMGTGKKFPNHKVSINIYGAQGGYIVEIAKGGYGNEPDLHIIPDAEDFDRALGKIITHHQLKQI
jgi:hypothetical protein